MKWIDIIIVMLYLAITIIYIIEGEVMLSILWGALTIANFATYLLKKGLDDEEDIY